MRDSEVVNDQQVAGDELKVDGASLMNRAECTELIVAQRTPVAPDALVGAIRVRQRAEDGVAIEPRGVSVEDR